MTYYHTIIPDPFSEGGVDAIVSMYATEPATINPTNGRACVTFRAGAFTMTLYLLPEAADKIAHDLRHVAAEQRDVDARQTPEVAA